ncbi:MAG: hypothetical protein RLZ71_418 [Actinomycetota bacterium]
MSDAPEDLPLLNEPRSEVIYVEDLTELEAAIKTLRGATGPFALDAERASGFKYSQRAYLVQVHRRGAPIYLIDPIAFSVPELAALAALLTEDTWILHAATQDMPCLAELGLTPKSLFDTELISRLLGFERVGLGAVCERLLGIRLAKEHSAADWSTRPLPESWLNYAALDVDVLPDLYDAMLTEVQSQGKQAIVAAEMQHLLSFKPKPTKTDKWRGLSGIQNVKERQGLAVARSLWQAREDLAIRLDVSPGRLVPDLSITHVAAKIPSSKSVLAGDKSFNGRASRSYLDVWWAAISAGAASRELPEMRVASTGIPNHRNWEAKFPEAAARLRVARDVISELSKETSIPAENILTPDYLRALCFEPRGLDAESSSTQLLELGARAWQVELVAEPLSKAFLAL